VGRSAAELHENGDPTTNGARGAGRWVVDGSAGRPSNTTGKVTPINAWGFRGEGGRRGKRSPRRMGSGGTM